MDAATGVAWSLLPMSVKVGVGLVYMLSNVRKTYETVAWVTTMIPSRTPSHQEERSEGWVWVSNDTEFQFN
jgi:hypothetical protein